MYHHRNKYIHSVGVVGQVEWRSVGSHPYTGVFTGMGEYLAKIRRKMSVIIAKKKSKLEKF